MMQTQKEQEAQVAAQVASEIRQNAERKEALQRQEKQQMKLRQRSISNATDLTYTGESHEERFDDTIRLGDLTFNAVQLSARKQGASLPSPDSIQPDFAQGFIGTTYRAVPVVEKPESVILELLVVVFSASFYQETQGEWFWSTAECSEMCFRMEKTSGDGE
jgi:translation initiation factor 2-alpha kinase 4